MSEEFKLDNLEIKDFDTEVKEKKDTEKDNIKTLYNLSFSGGGFKGAAFLGCVKALKQHNLLDNVKCVAGSSAGALVATLIACKAEYVFMKKCTMKTLQHFDKYRFSWYHVFKNAQNVSKDYGVFQTEELQKIFTAYVQEASNLKGRITFKSLYELTQIKLIITATSLDSKTPFYFNYETTPNTEISEALTISVNIPLLFAAKKYNNERMVDGCIIEHLPMECWKDVEIENTMAFLVKSRNEVFHLRTEVDSIYDYVEKLMSAVKKAADEAYLQKYKDTICLVVTQLSAYGKLPTDEELKNITHSSYFQTLKALEKKNFIPDSKIRTSGTISSFIITEDEESLNDHPKWITDKHINKRVLTFIYTILCLILVIRLCQ